MTNRLICRGKLLGWGFFLALNCAGWPSLTWAADVTVPTAILNKSLWTAEESYTIFKANDYDKPVLLTALISMYRSNPGMSANDAQAKLSSMKQSLVDGLKIRPPEATISLDLQNQNFQRLVKLGFTTASLSPDPVVKAVAVAGGGLWDYYTRAANDLGNSESQLYSDVKFGNKSNNAPSAAFLQKQLQAAGDLGTNAEFVKALQSIGFENPNTPIDELLQRHPNFSDHEVIDLLKTLIGPDGLKVDVSQLVNTQEVVSQRLLDLIGVVKSDIVSQNALQASFQAYLADQNQRQTQINLEQAASQLDALKIEATRSSVYILSTLVGFADPKLGRTLGGAGNAFLQAADAFNKYRVAMSVLDNSKLDADQKLFGSALGGISMAGNMLSVGLQVFSLFNDSGPSPELAQLGQISLQLKQLSQQVADFRNEMHQRFDEVDQRFDRVDATLSAIYGALTSQLSSIDWTLKQVSGDLTTIRTSLSDLQTDVRTLEQRINEMISDGFRRDFQDKISLAIGYREHFNLVMPRDQFNGYADYFKQWATVHSGDSLELSPANRPYDDASVYDQLNAYPLAFNLNYLNLYPSTKFGLPSLFSSPSQVVNPNDWIIASAAFVRLLNEWPDYARQGNFDSDIAAIQSTGTSLISGLSSITKTPDGAANYALFDKLIGRGSIHPSSYRGTLQQLHNEIESRRIAYKANLGNTLTDLNPWSGVEQSTQYTIRVLQDSSYRLYYVYFVPTNFAPPDDLIGKLGIRQPANLNGFLPASLRNSEQLNTNGYMMKFSVYPGYLGDHVVNGVRMLKSAYVIRGYFVPSGANGGDETNIVFARWMQGPDVQDPGGSDLGWAGWKLRTNVSWQFLVDQWESNYRTRFVAESQEGDCDNGFVNGCMAPEPNVKAWITYNTFNIYEAARQTLRNQQRVFYSSISPAITAVGLLQNLAKGVLGAHRALSSFIELGCPQAVGSNEYLRSLLAGPAEFADLPSIRAVIDHAVNEANQNPQQDLVIDFTSVGAPWIAQVEGIVLRVLGAIDQADNSEHVSVLETALSRLQTLREIRKLPIATDVTNKLNISSSQYVFDTSKNRYTQVVSLQNIGISDIQGPIEFVLG